MRVAWLPQKGFTDGAIALGVEREELAYPQFPSLPPAPALPLTGEGGGVWGRMGVCHWVVASRTVAKHLSSRRIHLGDGVVPATRN